MTLVMACGPSLEPAHGSGSGGGETSSSPPEPEPATDSATTNVGPGTTDTGEASDEGTIFLVVADGGLSEPCRPSVQDCPTGEKCVPRTENDTVWNATICTPIPRDPAAIGEPCTAEGSPFSGVDDCELGAMCWGVDPDDLQGTCVGLCDPADPTACPPGSSCVAGEGFAPYVCMPSCDPLDPVACAHDEVCRDIGYQLVCIATDVLPQGLPCGAGSCADDQTCGYAWMLEGCTDTECCTGWCDLSAPEPDAPCAAEQAGHVCQPFLPPSQPIEGYEHLGLCRLPP